MNLELGTSDKMNKLCTDEMRKTKKAIIRIIMQEKIRRIHIKELWSLKYREMKYWREHNWILQREFFYEL